MKWLINWGVKKYAVNIVNDALAKYNVNVDRARAIVAQYANKLRLLLDFLDRLDDYGDSLDFSDQGEFIISFAEQFKHEVYGEEGSTDKPPWPPCASIISIVFANEQ